MSTALPVDVRVAVVQLGDDLGGNLLGLADLQRQPDRAGDVFDHHRSLDGGLGRLAPMVKTP